MRSKKDGLIWTFFVAQIKEIWVWRQSPKAQRVWTHKHFNTFYFITQKSETLISSTPILYLYSTRVLLPSKHWIFVGIVYPLLPEHYRNVSEAFKLENLKAPATYRMNLYWNQQRFCAYRILHLMSNFWWGWVQDEHCTLSTILPLFMFLQAWYWVNRMTMLTLRTRRLK